MTGGDDFEGRETGHGQAPLLLEVHSTWVDDWEVADDLDRRVFGRGCSDPTDAARTLRSFIEHCARPVRFGSADLMRDAAVVEFSKGFPEEGGVHRLHLQRDVTFASVVPGAPEPVFLTDITMEFATASSLEALPSFLAIDAPAASNPVGAYTGDQYSDEIAGPNAVVAHLETLEELFGAVTTSRVAPLFGQRATAVLRATPEPPPLRIRGARRRLGRKNL
ncbi:MAG: hypothetical protein F2817_09510 [Actinobacteria bacterium]|nr:hypothetical protein [Actinomycetota bacterium]